MAGYIHDTIKAWRILDPEFKKVFQCSDVEFDVSRTAYTCHALTMREMH